MAAEANPASRRFFDLALLVLFAGPAIFLIALGAIVVKVSSPGPAIYRGRRIGRDGAPFELLKLRSMHADPGGHSASAQPLTQRGDPRVFPAGRWLRRLKVDELPQLWNIARGEMSWAGPRPEAAELVDSLYGEVERRSLRCRPGLTSPGALFETELAPHFDVGDPDHYARLVLPTKLAIDLAWLERRTVASDAGVLARTLISVLRRILGATRSPELLLRTLPPDIDPDLKLRLTNEVRAQVAAS